MAQTQNLNQFGMAALKGEVAAMPNPVTLSVQVDPASSNTIVAGDAVKLMSGVVGKQIIVDKCAATDITFGFVIRNPKKDAWTASQSLEIALPNSIIVLESYAAINRGQQVEFYPTGSKVKAAAGVNPVCGTCLDQIGGANTLGRIMVRTVAEYSSSSSCSSSSSRSSSSSSKSA